MIKVESIPTMGIFDGKKLTTTLNGDEMIQKVQIDLMFEFVDK